MFCFRGLLFSSFLLSASAVAVSVQASHIKEPVSEQAPLPVTADAAEGMVLKPLTKTSRFTNKTDAVMSLDAMYSGHASHAFWKVINDQHQAVEDVKDIAGESKQAILYGEILPRSFMQLLDHIGAQPGQSFYDLGSGTGKAVMGAWLLGLDATGVEAVQTRWDTSCKVVANSHNMGFKQAEDGPRVSFVHENFLTTDLSKADIVFINDVMFAPEMMGKLAPVARRMKAGSKIISTLGLPGDGFLLDDMVVAPTSWNLATRWIVQTVSEQVTIGTPVKAAEVLVSQTGSTPTVREVQPSASLMRKESPIQQNMKLTEVPENVKESMKLTELPSTEKKLSKTCGFDGYTTPEAAGPTLDKKAPQLKASEVL